MGKIRIKTIGLPEEEEKEKKKAKEKRETKKLTKVPGLKGGERVVSVGVSEEELVKDLEMEGKPEESKEPKSKEKKSHEQKPKATTRKVRSKNYLANTNLVDKTKLYPLSEALKILSEFKKSRFDETVELHINTASSLSTTATLPHGTGKKTRIAVANDELINQIEKGKIDFDMLVASPAIMPKLAKVAKILGPRGLMPNPKNGTITEKPEAVIKKYESGQINIKTEAKAPVIHLTVGKVSFGEKKLTDNIESVIGAIKKENIKKVVLKSTMSPGIKIRV